MVLFANQEASAADLFFFLQLISQRFSCQFGPEVLHILCIGIDGMFLAAATPIWHRPQEEAEVGRHGHRSGDFLRSSGFFKKQWVSEIEVYPPSWCLFHGKLMIPDTMGYHMLKPGDIWPQNSWYPAVQSSTSSVWIVNIYMSESVQKWCPVPWKCASKSVVAWTWEFHPNGEICTSVCFS